MPEITAIGPTIVSTIDAEPNTNLLTDAERTKLAGIEPNATADQTAAEIEAAYNVRVPIVSQADAEAGTAMVVARWTPQRVAQAVAALAGAGVPVDDTTALVRDPVDNTKLVRIDAGAVAPGATRALLMPDQNVTPVDTADARLSDARTPTSHQHPLADVSDAGALAALNTVGSAQLDDDAVTLAKQAHGTANRLQGFDGAGVPSEVVPGPGLSLVDGTLAATGAGGGDVLISGDPGNTLTTGVGLWSGTFANYDIGSKNANTLYFIEAG